MRFQRRGGRKRIVAPDGSELAPTSKPQPDGTLVKALARAWRWQRMLDEGVYTSVSEIGDAENISKSYVSRILRLALLAPDIVEAILAGQDGSGADGGAVGAVTGPLRGTVAPAQIELNASLGFGTIDETMPKFRTYASGQTACRTTALLSACQPASRSRPASRRSPKIRVPNSTLRQPGDALTTVIRAVIVTSRIAPAMVPR